MGTHRQLILFGSAEMASLAHFYFSHDSDYEVVAFTVDDEYCGSDSFEGLPLLPWSQVRNQFPPQAYDMHVALSYKRLNRLRQEKYEQVKAAGYTLPSYVCSKSAIWPELVVGDNCFILENQTIQPSCRVGNNVVLWSGNHVGHGTEIGDHTYVASHVVVSGHCKIGQRCFLGVNASLRDFLTLGDECFVAMDASIVRDMPSGSVGLGRTGEILDADDRRAKMLKKKYFQL